MKNWTLAMNVAYSEGLDDGQNNRPFDVSENSIYFACYKQGYEHGNKLPDFNIEWIAVRMLWEHDKNKVKIQERKTCFVFCLDGKPNAVICWGSNDAKEAQMWLKQHC